MGKEQTKIITKDCQQQVKLKEKSQTSTIKL